MALRTVALIRVVVIASLPFLAGCYGGSYNTDGLMLMGEGLQNYGAQRASYQAPAYHTTLCQPVGRTVMCY